ncbi:MAG: hypothetical protein HQL97_13285 [Magnetococcales bacterium]|nr:hypothetical protein [Magnetococcales bacterium]MBF0262795.1 hypothetical protein [Magnetococcales bacterium]
MLAIEMSTDMEEMFQSVSRETGRPLHDLVHEAMDRFLEEWEDLKDAQEAAKVLEEYRRNPGPVFTLEEAMERYGVPQNQLAP